MLTLLLGALAISWAEDVQSTGPSLDATLVESHTPLPDEALRSGSRIFKEDPEVKALEKQYYNLSDMVKSQASVVAQHSTIISQDAQESGKDKEDLKQLGAAYGQAHARADNASRAYKAHLEALAAAKKQRDELKNKTDEARKCLEEVGPQYQAAEYHYNILLSKTDLFQDIAEYTSDDETQKGKDLMAAEQHAETAQAKVQADDAALEAALAKLNYLNAELSKIQDKLNKEGSERGGAFGPSFSMLGLMIAFVW